MKNKTMDISLPREFIEKIEVYVKEGRFKSIEDFIEQAVNLLLYAEENKNFFMQAMGN